MFYLYHHYDLERLAELLSVLMARRARTHVLAPETILVPNHGLGRWLQIRLTEADGIAANLALPLPARFIWQLIPAALPDQPDSREFERAHLRWHLYSLLPTVAAHNTAIAGYLAREPRDMQRLQLADRLADVFDQYLIYRPQLLYAWEAGRITDADPDRWQAAVWRALTNKLGTDHRARLLHRFIEADDKDLDTSSLPRSLYCFSLGNLPPEYVKFFYALARHIDVHFLLANPCEGYWGDIQRRPLQLAAPPEQAPEDEEIAIEAGHPLLASLGRGIRDLLRVLYAEELNEIQEPELGGALAYEPPSGDDLLARVKTDIIRMAAPVADAGMHADDASIQIHACHGPLREVQILHDQLLDLLSRHSALEARDIVVMMPDVTAYAPAIHGVFGGAQGRRYLPYSLSDRSLATSHPIMQSFARLLDLPLSRWGASEILALAAVPAIMRRFDLDDASLQTARGWVQSAGVRWGFDADSRTAFGADAHTHYTWRSGLDRLLLGFAQSDDEALVAGVAPWSDLEGGGSATLGNLWYLVERLRTWSERLTEPAAAARWQERLNAMLDGLFLPDPDDAAEQRAVEDLRGAIAVLDQAAECLEAENLTWEVIRETLRGELGQAGERQPFLAGGITFCGVMPLRAVPFPVVCLLGMNDGDFPRQEHNRAVNILRARPRLGDHSGRDDDRLLFLQAVMAARRVFYLSYTGQDVASGETLPPSTLVGEWLDFLHRHYFANQTRKAFEARLITRQPLQPFGERLFKPQPDHPRLFTFAAEWQPASAAGQYARTHAPGFVDGARAETAHHESIELSQLKRFFDHPAQFFLHDRLLIHFETLADDIPDSEPLQLNGLEAWQLRDHLLRQAQTEGGSDIPETPSALWRARDVLPPPPLDLAPFAKQAERVNMLLPVWRTWTANDEQPGWLDIDLNLSDQRLVGRIPGMWPDGLRLCRAGRLKMTYRLRAWIDYLAYRAAGNDGSLRLAGLNDKQTYAIEYRAELDEATARGHLAQLLQLFEAGQQQPLLFLPDLAEQYLRAMQQHGNPSEALRGLNKRLSDTYKPAHEAQDPYFAPMLVAHAPLGQDWGDTPFCELAEAICEPPLNQMTLVEHNET